MPTRQLLADQVNNWIDRLVPWGLGASLGIWMGIQVLGLGIAAANFEGPEDPQYYKNGLRYAQVMAAGKSAPQVRLEAPEGARAGQDLTLRVRGASQVRVGRPATLREDRLLPVKDGQVKLRLPRGWWVAKAGESQVRFRVLP